MRRFVLLMLPALLSGCAIPATLVIASYGADGLSYLSSGKSLEDHGISTVLDEDCALHRVLIQKPICKDFNPPNPGILFAKAPSEPAGTPASAPAAEPIESAAPTAHAPVVPVETRALAAIPRPPAPPVKPSDVAALPGGKERPVGSTIAAGVSPRRYLVLGSFSTHENAARFVKQLGKTDLTVVSVKLQGRTLYRVVTGPLTITRVANLRERLPGDVAGQSWEVASLSPG